MATIAFLLPFITLEYHLYVLSTAFIIAGVSIAWNIMGGFCGQVSFGHAAFFGVGAYVSAILSVDWNLPPILTVPIGTVAALILAGAIGIPCFRLRGAYFALAMLAIAEILRLVCINWVEVTHGPAGVYGIPPFSQVIGTSRRANYFIVLIILMVTVYISYLISKSRYGLAFRSILNDELSAEVSGVNTFKMKMLACIISAALTGLFGAIYAHYMYYIDPQTVFGIKYSLLPIATTLFGGINTVAGPLLGAVSLILLDEYVFRPIFPGLHEFIYGAVLLIVILFMPNGIAGSLKSIWSIKRK